MNTQTAAVTRLATALAAALGPSWHPATLTDPERRTAFILQAVTGSWVVALADPLSKQLALAAAQSGRPPRQAATFKPDLDDETNLYDWLATADLADPAEEMATAALAALTATHPDA
ncbi:hypothetical protein AB0M86_24915 [Streptomyces sp. NPDC051639]|uniref:hypothetical protein n=1 Tax=Streptomyces sp. NPDC051639 TaxID=3155671 RepID=UPI00343BED14